jgi:hypothetical protein
MSINPNKRSLIKIILIAAGTVSLGLGILGIVLPLLPTTPFLLLTAACYARSSDKFYNWLINHMWLGPYIKNYKEGKGIPLRIRVITVALLWGTILLSVFLVVKMLWLKVILLLIAAGVTIHVVSLGKRRNAKTDS